MSSSNTLALADLKVDLDGDPRVLDLTLAERLGFERPRKIRELIERHRDELERYGEVCPIVGQTSRNGGRPGVSYWLNEAQALLICMFSNTARAADVRQSVIEVFTAWRQGRLVTRRPEADQRLADRAERRRQNRIRHWQGQAAIAAAQLAALDADAATLPPPAAAPAPVFARPDPLGRFLAECTAADPAGRIRAGELHRLYTAWAETRAAAALTGTALGRALRARGVRKLKSNGVWWLGLRVVRTVDDLARERFEAWQAAMEADGWDFEEREGGFYHGTEPRRRRMQ